MEKVYKQIRANLYELSLLLQNTLPEFVMVSEETKDIKLKMPWEDLQLRRGSIKTSQLRNLRIKEIDCPRLDRFEQLLQKSSTVKEISEVCCTAEGFFDKTYGKVFNECLLN